MNIYEMYTTLDSDEMYLDIKDGDNRIFKFFILGMDDNRIKKKYPINVFAQSFYNSENILKFDFLKSTEPFPIFSKNAKNKLEKELKSKIDFYPCNINVEGNIYEGYIGKILIYKKIFERIDDYKIKLIDGSILKDDYIVRDEMNENLYVVTEKFKELSLDLGLNIGFKSYSFFK